MRYLIILLLFISCRDFKDPVDILEGQGYSKVQILPEMRWSCRGYERKHHSTHFKAVKDGKTVTGNICYDYDGGYSIEIKNPVNTGK